MIESAVLTTAEAAENAGGKLLYMVRLLKDQRPGRVLVPNAFGQWFEHDPPPKLHCSFHPNDKEYWVILGFETRPSGVPLVEILEE